MSRSQNAFGWQKIARLGLVQACIGGVVVLATSTLNRVIVVELSLAAVIPGLMVAGHYLLQILRPRMGFGTDQTGRCTPWIRGGLLVLALGGVIASMGTGLMVEQFWLGLLVCAGGFVGIGIGVSACGTSVLALLAKSVEGPRRAAAATLVWLMMIAGFAITAGLSGRFLDPFTMDRLLIVSLWVAGLAIVLTLLATWRLEPARWAPAARASAPSPLSFRQAMATVLTEPAVRRFTVFVFVSMLAFSAQDLILEPYAGLVFGYSPGQSTQLSGLQHAGVLVGMLLVPASQRLPRFGRAPGLLRFWTIAGCLLSGLALLALTVGGRLPSVWPLGLNVFLLGAANGAFSIAAIASMMALANRGVAAHEGTRMGVWGAAQALAFACGGLIGTALADTAGHLVDDLATAYGLVFFLEACAFVVAAALGARLDAPIGLPHPSPQTHQETCRA